MFAKKSPFITAFVAGSFLLAILMGSLWARTHYRVGPRQTLEKLAQRHEARLEQYIDRSVFLSLDNVFRLPVPGAGEEPADYMLRLITFEQTVTALLSDLNAASPASPAMQWFMEGFPYGDTLYISPLDRLDAGLAQEILQNGTSQIHYPRALLCRQEETEFLRFYRNLTGMLGDARVILCVNLPFAPLERGIREAEAELNALPVRYLAPGAAPAPMPGCASMQSRLLADGSRYAVYVPYYRWALAYLLPLCLWALFCAGAVAFARFVRRQAEKAVEDGLSVLIDAAESGGAWKGGESETEKLLARLSDICQRQILKQRETDLMRVQLMQERMNPHLLYNFLASVKMRALRARDEELATLTDAMAQFFAEALSREDNDQALVASELNMANQYILLSNQLYGKHILLMVQVEPGLRHGKILKHMIQPLVENAFKHGFRQKESGIIKIIGRQAGRYRQITVIDTGCGMDGETARALEAGACRRERGGYAMNNLYARMKLYYGQSASIRVFSQPEEGTSIRLSFR